MRVTKTFKHSGDLGDIVYSLPTIRALGGGILYLDPNGGEDDPFIKMQCIDGKTRLSKQTIDTLSPLLKLQPYISDVKYWNGEKVDYNLDEFRKKFNDPRKRSKTSNLADLHLEQFNLPFSEVEKPWLHVDGEIKLHKKVIIARSPRVQGGFGTLNATKFFLRDNAIFVGVPKEHEFFEWTFGIKIDYHKTDTILELFKVIKGSELFIGNSSFPLSLAIGMGHPHIRQEVDPKVPTTVFENMKNMSYF
jgi:hypothetical protein